MGIMCLQICCSNRMRGKKNKSLENFVAQTDVRAEFWH